MHASRGCDREGIALHLTEGLAMSDPILALDRGRYKSVARTYSRATRAYAFRTCALEVVPYGLLAGAPSDNRRSVQGPMAIKLLARRVQHGPEATAMSRDDDA